MQVDCSSYRCPACQLGVVSLLFFVLGTGKLLEASQQFFDNAEKTFEDANQNIQENVMQLLGELRGDKEPIVNNLFEKYGYDDMENLLDGPKYANVMEDNAPIGYGTANEEWDNEVLPGNRGYDRWEEEEPYVDPRFELGP